MRKGEELSYFVMACIFLAALILIAPSLGETPATVNKGTISGYIYDVNTKQPLSQAFVYCQEVKSTKKTTDRQGYYFIEGDFLPSKTYNIICTKYGYDSIKEIATTNASGKATKDFYLSSTESSMNDSNSRGVLFEIHIGDNNTKQPIIGARINIIDEERNQKLFEKYTDKNGLTILYMDEFDLNQSYSLLVESTGYKSFPDDKRNEHFKFRLGPIKEENGLNAKTSLMLQPLSGILNDDCPNILDHKVTNDINEGKQIKESKSYCDTDNKVISWMRIGPVNGKHEIKWEWYGPNDEMLYVLEAKPRQQSEDRVLYKKDSWITDPNTNDKELNCWSSISLDEIIDLDDDRKYIGDWEIKIYIDDKYEISESFKVSMCL